MADYESIVNVEEFIADHYFTTDETKGETYGKRVATVVKQWKEDQKGNPNLVTPLSAITSHRAEVLELLTTAEGSVLANQVLRTHLGYGNPAPHMVESASGHSFSLPAVVHHGLIAIDAPAAESPESLGELTLTVTEAGSEATKQEELSVTDVVGQIFLALDAPQFVVVFAGSWVFLAQRDTWPLGRFLAVDMALVLERNETKSKGELQRAVVALARENVEQRADGTCWWQETLDQALDHSIKVSESLRAAVKASIEIIGNDVLDRTAAAEGEEARYEVDGDDLAHEALRYLYRILFVLFAEARPELQILPTGTVEYDEGYGLARIREMILIPPVTTTAEQGTHLYDSLDLLFRLVDQGHQGSEDGDLTFRNISADLFAPSAIALIQRHKLSNKALHEVLVNLLLSPEKAGQDRGFISYATLGVSELGQVYEGLMSYKGFVAREELFEVAPKGDAYKGSWVVPTSREPDLPEDSYLTETQQNRYGESEKKRLRHRRGSFVFRQSSRDRERSASFYSPPVITEFTVGQAIEVLEEEEGRIAEAADILTLRICEPAMGSGAFAVEAVQQLAEKYLQMYQEETGERVDPAEYAEVLQRVKAHIALHQVYGVDLNATAVELAEISLWLDTMTSDLSAPWFGLRLRAGNSLIGAEHATYSAKQVADKEHLKVAPTRHPLSDLREHAEDPNLDPAVSGRIHHFLLPASGWGAAADNKELKKLAPEQAKALKAWQRSFNTKPSKTQINRLKDLSARVEQLWLFTLTRMSIAEEQVRRSIDFPGAPQLETAKNVTRAQIEEELFENKNSSYQRLRLVMDAWNALWFWPLDKVGEEHAELPDFDAWLDALTDILGVHKTKDSKVKGQTSLTANPSWEELGSFEDFDIPASGAKRIDRVFAEHPWLQVVKEIAGQQNFFHWELDFAAAFEHGGFDLQVGNPPWVRPRTDVDALLAESDPWFALAHKPTQKAKTERREKLLQRYPAAVEPLFRGLTETVVTAEVLGSASRYPFLVGQQPDLYRAFMQRTWANESASGAVSLVHPESHFTEAKAGVLRKNAYLRLRRHWQFVNELKLFDIDHHNPYGVHVYGGTQFSPNFKQAVSLYHPATVAESLVHDGSGPLPGFKDENYNWDRRPHRDRIIRVDRKEIEVWHSILEGSETPLLETRMVYTVNREAAAVLAKLAHQPRMRDLRLQYSRGWDESIDRRKGYFDVEWGHPEKWSDAILQGPHLGVSLPMQKEPNPTMKHNQDWSFIDLEAMPEDFIPATAYKPQRETKPNYNTDYGSWEIGGERVRVADTYRVAWRNMAATTGFRTMYPAIIPPGAAHIHGVTAASVFEDERAWSAGAFASGLVADFFFRAIGSHLHGSVFDLLPRIADEELAQRITLPYLQLNCLTSAYAELWEEILGEPWSREKALRIDEERRAAQIEIDVIAAISMGISADELCMVYRTQFPVMRRYDQENHFDANSRIVPKEVMNLHKRAGGEETLSVEDRTWTNPQSGVEYTYEYPFRVLDREADMRAKYAELEQELTTQP